MIKNIIFVYVGGCMISVLIDYGVFVIIINKEFFKKNLLCQLLVVFFSFLVSKRGKW